MGEEYFCLVGCVPKVLSYVKDGKYVHTICKLRENVDEFYLNEFFKRVYNLKLEIGGNCQLVDGLIKEFQLILQESSFINMKNLCFFVRDFESSFSYSVLGIVREFFEMFEVVDERLVSLNNVKEVKFIAVNSEDMFYKEVESIFYNSKVIDSLYNEQKAKVKKAFLGK